MPRSTHAVPNSRVRQKRRPVTRAILSGHRMASTVPESDMALYWPFRLPRRLSGVAYPQEEPRMHALIALIAALVCLQDSKADRWEKDIAAFEAKDKASPPPENEIVFVGSSSIRMWKST